MCIRDSRPVDHESGRHVVEEEEHHHGHDRVHGRHLPACTCLLYTSDAADERSSVDLGGRRIIKKKKLHTIRTLRMYYLHTTT